MLHQGIARHTPLSFGAANEVVGLIVLTIAWALGARVWIGTISNAVLIGLFIILLQPLHAVQAPSDWSLVPRIGLIVVGLICFGVGTAFYIGADLGAGPRDSLMLVGARRTGIRIGAVRAMLEISVLLVGFARRNRGRRHVGVRGADRPVGRSVVLAGRTGPLVT